MLDGTSVDLTQRSIRFGMPTPMECKTVDSLIAFCKETGFDFIELNNNFPLYTRENLERGRVFERLDAEGIDYSIHLPEMLDFGSLQSEFRDAALSMVARLSSSVKEGTRFICHMNTGIKVSLPQENIYIYERYDHQYFDALEEVSVALDPILEQSGCFLCMENLGNFNLPFIQKGLEILLSQDSIGLIWDFGHDTTAHLSDMPFFERHLDKLWELHLHDSKDGSDHRPLYTGNTDIKKALGLARQRSLPVVVEVKTLDGLRQSYGELVKHGYR